VRTVIGYTIISMLGLLTSIIKLYSLTAYVVLCPFSRSRGTNGLTLFGNQPDATYAVKEYKFLKLIKEICMTKPKPMRTLKHFKCKDCMYYPEHLNETFLCPIRLRTVNAFTSICVEGKKR